MKRLTLAGSAAFLLLCASAASGYLFPWPCVKGVAAWPVVCCEPYLGSTCGSALGRGQCYYQPASRTVPPTDVVDDDRRNFPRFYFNWTCLCNERFMGYNCGECAFGWTGDNCDVHYEVFRYNILLMSAAQVQNFLATMHYCKYKIDPDYAMLIVGDRFRKWSYRFTHGSFYDIMAHFHYYATKDLIVGGQERSFIDYAHGSLGFLTWHKLYLLLMERQIQKCMRDIHFGMPYYPWQLGTQCTVCSNDYLGASGPDGRISIYHVLSEWRMVCPVDYPGTVCPMEDCICERPRLRRMPGFGSVGIPSATSVNNCYNCPYVDTAPYTMSSSPRDSFRRCIEGLHNNMHIHFGGTMGEVIFAANDLIFFLHHCNVQRIANHYFETHGITPQDYPDVPVYSHGANDCISPLYNCWTHMEMLQPDIYHGTRYG